MKKICFFLGFLGPIAFVVLSGLAISLSSNVNSLSNPTSNLVGTQYGWLQNLAFIAGGIGFIFLGSSILLHQKKTKIAPYFVIFFGIVFVLESIFQSNASQTNAATGIYILLFALGTIGMIVATGLFGNILSTINGTLSAYSYLTTLISAVGFIGIFLTQGSVGLWQQVAIFVE